MIWVFLAALAWRSYFNNVETYSRADETTYVFCAQSRMPFRDQVKEFGASTGDTPSPLRFAWYALCALLCGRTVTHRRLAWISTAFSAAGVLVAYELGGFGAALLVAASPLSQAMGRRALQDAAVGTSVAAAFLAARTGQWAWTAAALTALLFLKDVSLLGWPGFLVLYLGVHGRLPILAFGLPPLVFAGTVVALNRGTSGLVTLVRKILNQEAYPYTMQYGRGPVHTYVLEFALLSPLVAVFAVRNWTWTPFTTGLAVYIATWSVLKFKNYRFFTGADIGLRVVAAATLPPLWLGVCVVADILVFRRVFVQRGVYDPTVYTVTQALDMVP